MNPFEEIGAYAPDAPVPQDIEFNGKTVRMWFVQHSYADFLDKVANPEVKEGQRRELVVLTNVVRFDAEGKTGPSYEDAARLHKDFVKVLAKAAYGVNGVDVSEPESDSKN